MSVAIVTGGARGIGAAVARRLGEDGAAVAVLDLEPDDAAGADFRVRADVGSLDSVEAAVARVVDELGPPTILVNNAGLSRPGFLHRVAVSDWELVQRVCVQGCFHLLRAVAPWFRDLDRAPGSPRRVVNISSVVGLHGTVGSAPYAAAKAGVIGLTKSMALEWAPYGVTVNAVAPGFIETPATDAMPDHARRAIVERIPLGRAGAPDDVAGAVAYLCSPAADYVTGQVLEVHGGLELVT